MKKILISTSKILILFTLLAIIFSSCVSQKKIKYLQQKPKEDTNTFFEINKTIGDYKVQPRDNLYIRIQSLDERVNSAFNSMASTGGVAGVVGSISQNPSVYLTSYSVSDEGYIEFPILGKIFVKELTIEQIKNLMQQLIDEYLKDAIVIVKMVNFKITILGEAKNPGIFDIYQNKINIFEAISMAGDLTDFANRNHVTLVRQVKSGSKIFKIDMTSNKLLNSELYYLSPNDIIYISPLRVKQYGFATFPYALVFSSITLLLTLLTFFQVFKS